jgi:two-component system cell cycle sensor histidine kinase PleC
MPGRHTPTASKNSLLARYSETLGEMQLRKHTERAIRAAKVEAELNSRSKSAFLSTMSHELRTPLNAIIGFSDLIRNPDPKDPDFEKSREYAAHISNAGRRLLEVVSDILDISKIESGAAPLTLRPLDLGRIIAEAAEAIQDKLHAKKQTLDLRQEANLPTLSLDAKRIRQILGNLLSNANKFTPEGGKLLLMARGNADGGATIAIADTGIGMSPEELAVATAPFGQVQSAYNRAQEGTGLGLPIALGLARLHGGSLTIKSEPNAGTTVILTLPSAPDARRERLAS